jgi:hypothetical protein
LVRAAEQLEVARRLLAKLLLVTTFASEGMLFFHSSTCQKLFLRGGAMAFDDSFARSHADSA